MNTTNRTLFNPSKETLLTRGLNSMTLACDALDKQVETLTEENTKLKQTVVQLNEIILSNNIVT